MECWEGAAHSRRFFCKIVSYRILLLIHVLLSTYPYMKLPVRVLAALTLGFFLFQACEEAPKAPENDPQPVEVGLPSPEGFKSNINGQSSELHVLEVDGIKAAFTSYGARLVSLLIQDKEQNWVDVVLGFNDVESYAQQGALYYGATVGRYANRIAGGTFVLEGDTIITPPNDRTNSLHGGVEGFSQQTWLMTASTERSLTYTYESPDGQMGFPGNLSTSVTYSIEEGPVLKIEYSAITDQPTIVNLTHHSYFNLNGEGTGDILSHTLSIPAESFLPVAQDLLPSGEIMPVEGTEFDFREPAVIGERIAVEPGIGQLGLGRGFDHNFVLTEDPTGEMQVAAQVTGDQSKITMRVLTTEPGIQFYTGNFMDGSLTGKSGKAYEFRNGFCLEPQHFP